MSIKSICIGLIVFYSLSLSACKDDQTLIEQEIPFVMVVQPSAQNTEQKSYAGDIQAVQQTPLSFRVAGQVVERYVDVGDQVHVGQVLAKLDVKDAQLQLNAMKAQLEQAQSSVKIAKDELQRYQQLLPMNAVSRSQYDAIENQYNSALAALKQAQSNYDVSLNQIRYNQLLAHKTGVITERNIEAGQFVSAGQPIYRLAIGNEKEVEIGVPEQSISTIKIGQLASIVLWSKPNEKFAGYVREISPIADSSRTFRVKVAFKPAQNNIQLGQSARIFFNDTQFQSLKVPLPSVSANQGQAYVWVVQPDQTVQKRWVRLGSYDRENVTILSGLNPTDYVVVGGVHLLREKQKIQPIDHENRTVIMSTGGQS